MCAGITKPMIRQDAKPGDKREAYKKENGEVQSTTNGMNPDMSTGTVYHV